MPLQKDAWRTLVEKEEFSLIGEPLSEQHLIAIDQGTASLLSAVGLGDIVFHKWVSGDYSAATDGLSLIAMEEYLRARGIPFGSVISGKLRPRFRAHMRSITERTTPSCLLKTGLLFLTAMS